MGWNLCEKLAVQFHPDGYFGLAWQIGLGVFEARETLPFGGWVRLHFEVRHVMSRSGTEGGDHESGACSCSCSCGCSGESADVSGGWQPGVLRATGGGGICICICICMCFCFYFYFCFCFRRCWCCCSRASCTAGPVHHLAVAERWCVTH